MKKPLMERLSAVGQEHLLRFWDELSPAQQAALASEIEVIDFALVAKLHAKQQAAEDWAALAMRAESPPAFRLDGQGNPFSREQAVARGEAALRAGGIGVMLVAGGQGTRLGFDHPKGMFPIGPVSGATIFQIVFEKVAAMRKRYGADLPLYLMTSPATHDETLPYLEENGWFGLPRQDVQVFCQGTMPAVDAKTGRLLLAEKGRLFLSPDGHGGMAAALAKGGSLEDMRRRGVKHLYYFQIDNPLAVVGDPEFMGYHLLAGSEMSTQVVAKRTSRDNVGNVVSIDGQVRILEYTELNPLADEIVLRKTPQGTPVFWAGNSAIHAFDVAFLERMAAGGGALPFHVARKKVPHIDEQGNDVEPSQPNAMKFERFVFDLLPAAKRAIVQEVDEAAVFAPVKNASGADRDSPETVKTQILALHRQWLEAAGAKVAPGVAVEISPLFALDEADVTRQIAAGTRFEKETYLGPT